MNLRDSCHNRTRVATGCALFNRDRRGESFDVLDIRFLHLIQKLTRIGGETLNIATLSFGIECVKGKRRFTRTAESGDNG